jgi:hypothetical protein
MHAFKLPSGDKLYLPVLKEDVEAFKTGTISVGEILQKMGVIPPTDRRARWGVESLVR